MSDQMLEVTRRNLLSGGAALASATLAGSTAGCLSLLPPVGQEVRYGRVDTPQPVSSDPVYRRWMPADHDIPDVDGLSSMSDAHWVSVTPGSLGLDTVGGEFRIGAAVAKARLDYVGYEFQFYDYVHSLGSLGVVAEGDIDSEVVTETLLDSGYARDGTYHDWQLFDRTDIPRAVAVSASAVVQSNGEHRRAGLETLLDAGDGRIDRHHEADETFDSFSEWAGSYPTILEDFGGGLVDPEPEEAAMGYTFDEEAIYFIYLQRHAAGETPSEGEIQQALEENQQRAVRAWAVDIEIDDPHVAVQMRIEKSDFTDSFVEDRSPYVTWGVDDDGDTVTIRHEAGNSVPVDQVDIEPEAALIDQPEPGTTIESGDELTVDTSEFPATEDTVSIIYNYEGTESDSAALLHYTPDELEHDQ